jgi:signal transduction histidine kinase
MNAFIEQLVSLVTVPPGNMLYHLVLAFSVAGVLQASLSNWRTSGFPQGRRMVMGLSLLFVLRLLLIASVGVAWQGLLDEHLLLPPVDRAVGLLSLIIIIWLWGFPEPLPLADAASWLLGFLGLTLFGLSMAWWIQQGGQLTFNNSWLDYYGEIVMLALLAGGALLLLVRRPNSWGFGLGMLGLLSVGHLAHLFYPPEGDFAGAVRLAEMAAYPLLWALPQRFPSTVSASPIPPQPAVQERRRFGTDPKLLQTYLTLATETDFTKIAWAISHAVAHSMLADLVLFVNPPSDDGHVKIHCGYDLIREDNLPGSEIASTQVPMISSALRTGRPLRLPASSTSPDLANLIKPYNLSRAGNILVAPILTADYKPIAGILLLSPYSNRNWNIEDQAYLLSITKSLAQLLQRSREITGQQTEKTPASQTTQELQAELQAARQEIESLLQRQQDLLAQASTSQAQAGSLAALIATQEESEQKINHLLAENEQLKRLGQSVVSPQATESTSAEAEYLQGEWRMALEEVARLNQALAEAEQKLAALRTAPGSGEPAPDESTKALLNMAQELRHPMSSILGYTDLLLGESVGILGAVQRRFLERIKVSTERMARLVDDLIQMTLVETSDVQFSPEIVDLNKAINEAIAQTNPRLQEKHIDLRLDLPPEKLPAIKANRDALQQIVMNLLLNASSVTPTRGEILLRALVHCNEDEQNYVLIQVGDQGGGIAQEDMPRVFSRLFRPDQAQIPGLGEANMELSTVKAMVEALTGRIWVDSNPGVGSIFSVIIPVMATSSNNGSGAKGNE